MKYEKPEVKVLRFRAESFLNNEIDFSAVSDDNPDDSNWNDMAYEALNNIFGP